jgi:photosystem II stability/assembly factor-like uncharacterized protein
MKKTIGFIFAVAVFMALGGIGCISFDSTPTGAQGGIWKTTDQGELWEQKVSFPTPEGVGKIGHVSVQVIAIDPSDHLALYAGTSADGLLYSYDGAQSWGSAKQLDSGPIADIAIDPKDKCNVYAASRNKVYKSIDCNRTFEQAYYETRTDVKVTDVEIDWYNSTIVYAGTSDGDLLKSADAGASWAPVHRFDGDINDILIDPFDSRAIYIGTENKGLWKSIDGGETWDDFEAELKEFKNSRDIYFLVADKTNQSTLVIATKYGLLRTVDAGSSWTEVELVTPPGEAVITSLVLNPREGKEMYYTTASTFYKSVDAGASWVTKKVPAVDKGASALAIDPENNKVIYLGVSETKKESY